MFKFIGWIFKATLFAVLILIGSHFVSWNGRSVSDQVRSSISSAERSPSLKAVKKTSARLLEDARTAAEDAISSEKAGKKEGNIPEEDKEELRALIDSDANRG